MRRAILAGTLCALALAVGCGGDGGAGPGATAESRTDEGWALFEAGDYTGAIGKFNEAVAIDDEYADAYNGLGWSFAKLDSLARALTHFGSSISNGMTGDPHAGRAPVYRDVDPPEFANAVSTATTALNHDRRYEFEHDTDFDWRDLHLIMAQSHFGLGQYDLANAEVDSLGGNVQNPSSSTFVEDLADEIERLEGVYGS
ncbi:MAG: tetratricopeptide repeat protein [bacterium]|jgi:tetratricopeptide (TPR) repeat protein